ncbi:MAG: 50S ribosomal protein L29 [Candidatus Omnitrophica bacterium]|nr:50S ribosomal protein L29 [Candidatus Omnitrophota bacterium]
MGKHVKASELRVLPPAELRQKAEGLTKELMTIRLKAKIGGIEKPHRIRLLKRDLARIATVARAQQAQEARAA